MAAVHVIRRSECGSHWNIRKSSQSVRRKSKQLYFKICNCRWHPASSVCAQSMTWKHVTSHFSTIQKVSRCCISLQSCGYCIRGFWRNCTDWLCGTWQHYNRNLLCWRDWKMLSGTERRETRKVTSRCAIPPGQCACLQALTAIWNIGFELLRHPPYSPDLDPSDFCLLPKLKKFMKWRKFVDDEDVTCTVSGWLRTNIRNSSTVEFGLWRNVGPSAFLLEGTVLESDKISCTYSVCNCVRLRTFWTPLIRWFLVLSQ